MIKSVIGLAATAFLSVGCQSNIYHIKGEAKDFADGTKLYMTAEMDSMHRTLDTITVNNGKFRYEGETDSVVLCRLYCPKVPETALLFFIEPGNLYIELSKVAGLSRVSGTKVNNEWQALNDTVAKYDEQLRTLFHPKDSISPRKVYSETDRIYTTLTRRITETAARNRDNALGRFINTKKPATY